MRSLRKRDLPAVGALLDEAFAGHREAMRFEPSLLGLFAGWTWRLPGHSLVVDEDGLVGVAMAGRRRAHFAGTRLDVVHVGPIGVLPSARKRGLARSMLARIERDARAKGRDLLTLTTESGYGVHRLYEGAGYRALERYRPSLAALSGTAGEIYAEELDARSFWRRWELFPPRVGAIAEVLEDPPKPGAELRPRYLAVDGAAVATIDWPVVSRARRQRSLRSTQVVARVGEGEALRRAVTAAAREAAQAGSEVVYALPSLQLEHPLLQPQGPLVVRMVKALSRAAERVLRDATCYDEICPAP